MRTLKYSALLVVIISLFACSEEAAKSSGYHIKGQIKGTAGQPIKLNELSLDGNIPLDTAIADAEGNFEFKGKLKNGEGIYMLYVDNQHNWAIYMDEGAEFTFNAYYNDVFSYNLEGAGKKADILAGFIARVSGNSRRTQELQQEFQQARFGGDMNNLQRIQMEFQQQNQKNITEIKAFIDTVTVPQIGVFASSLLNLDQEAEYLAPKIAEYTEQLPNSPLAKSLNKKFSKLTRLSIGRQAPGFALKSPKGQEIALSDVKGEVILIDFWASWCKPCRRENPNLVRTYERYKDRGFEVYSVSLDKDMGRWVAAINQDNLTWPYHGSNLKSWNCPVAREYNVSSIPATFLVDKNGKILAKNLRGAQLDAKLLEIFGA